MLPYSRKESLLGLPGPRLCYERHPLYSRTRQEQRQPLQRDLFSRTLVRELAGSLQSVVGLEDASGFISVVDQRMGAQINHDYKNALRVERLDRAQVAQVLVDLKRRIQGDFYVLREDDQKIVLGNRHCPFEEKS